MASSLEARSSQIGSVTAPPQQVDPIEQVDTPKGEISHNTSTVGVQALTKSDWVYLTTLTWTRAMEPGTVIFKTPIHPTSCNPYVQYLARMFNTYVGSMAIRMKVVGTAFYGGDLRICIVPPNIQMDDIAKLPLSYLTALPNRAYDPKDSAYVEQHTTDQRNVLYHYNSDAPDFSDPSNFGGYYVIFVVAKLVTQSNEFNDLQILLETTGDFEFTQPAPLFAGSGPTPTPTLLPPWATQHVLMQSGCDDNAADFGNFNAVILPSTIQSLPSGGVFGAGINGKSIDQFPGSNLSENVLTYRRQIQEKSKTLHLVSNGHFSRHGTNATKWIGDSEQVPPINAEKTGFFCQMAWADPAAEATGPVSLTSMEYAVQANGTVQVQFPDQSASHSVPYRSTRTGLILGQDVNNVPSPVDVTLLQSHDGSKLQPMAPGESILVFTNKKYKTVNVQTQQIAAAMKDVEFNMDSSAVFSIRPYLTGLPIRQVRLNPNGFFTTNASATNILIEDDFYFQFEYMLPLVSPLPPLSGDLLIHDYSMRHATKSMMKTYARLALEH
jgi:hypothetical protein